MKKSDLQFSNPWLEYLNFVQNDQFEKVDSEINMKNSFQIQVNKFEEKSENEAKVSLTLEVNKGEENSPFILEITMSAFFRWNSKIEYNIDEMLNTNAPALLLGYMRPIVAGITNSSKYPVYNLPFINFLEDSDN